MSNVVIVPVHNQVAYLKKCVESVVARTKDLELIIVDDGSTDVKTRNWIDANKSKYKYHVIRHEKALGFSKACNDGMQYALDHFNFVCLCLLNSDTVIETIDWFDKVKYYFEKQEVVGVAGVMSDNALAQSVKNVHSYLKTIESRPAAYSYFIHGFCYFIGKRLIEKIGLLDEIMFPHYGSEDDYSIRCLIAGFKNLLVGRVFVYHNNETSYGEEQRKKIVAKSFPDLNKKYGKYLVDRLGVMSVKVANHIKHQQYAKM
jgi:GT2 family glycosyltransferase